VQREIRPRTRRGRPRRRSSGMPSARRWCWCGWRSNHPLLTMRGRCWRSRTPGGAVFESPPLVAYPRRRQPPGTPLRWCRRFVLDRGCSDSYVVTKKDVAPVGANGVDFHQVGCPRIEYQRAHGPRVDLGRRSRGRDRPHGGQRRRVGWAVNWIKLGTSMVVSMWRTSGICWSGTG
jgi:hypothetical protein